MSFDDPTRSSHSPPSLVHLELLPSMARAPSLLKFPLTSLPPRVRISFDFLQPTTNSGPTCPLALPPPLAPTRKSRPPSQLRRRQQRRQQSNISITNADIAAHRKKCRGRVAASAAGPAKAPPSGGVPRPKMRRRRGKLLPVLPLIISYFPSSRLKESTIFRVCVLQSGVSRFCVFGGGMLGPKGIVRRGLWLPTAVSGRPLFFRLVL